MSISLADQQEKLGRHADLAEVLRALLRQTPEDIGIAFRLVRLLEKQGKLGDARSLLDRYQDQPLASRDQYVPWAELLLHNGRYALALSDL